MPAKPVVHRLAGAEWNVLAGVRRAQDAEPLRAAHPLRVTPVTLDITDPEHIAALERSLPDRLDGVVNNAGVVVAGPLEAVPPAELRRQLDVNVVGQSPRRPCRACAPRGGAWCSSPRSAG